MGKLGNKGSDPSVVSVSVLMLQGFSLSGFVNIFSLCITQY